MAAPRLRPESGSVAVPSWRVVPVPIDPQLAKNSTVRPATPAPDTSVRVAVNCLLDPVPLDARAREVLPSKPVKCAEEAASVYSSGRPMKTAFSE